MNYNFITVRLGKDSLPEIQCICDSFKGILEQGLNITVRCTQIPDNYKAGDYAFIWLGSDNNKGMPTKWKQGFKAFGIVQSINRGLKYNDISQTDITVLYIFEESVNRLDILRNAASAYYWCSSMPLIGIDDHANQTIRSIYGDALCDIGAFFWALEKVTKRFKRDIITINPDFADFFKTKIPSPHLYPNVKSLSSIEEVTNVFCNYCYFRPFLTAIKSKPFMLLAGISGTGKSRIVRELARACWNVDSEEYKAQKPKNFEMVQVKPNWHDSGELIGYVSRVSGKAEFVAGDFLKFVAKAWEDLETPYFLCLDEMNLAPVEQYFAEYLSVVESRKRNEEGMVVTDPIIYPQYEHKRDENTGELISKEWYKNLVKELLAECPTEKSFALNKQFMSEGISLPQNLIVIGTVNMDETTFSFSRKVLDRAMTIEMNEVDLYGGLTNRHEVIGKIGCNELVGTAVEGVDVYSDNKEVCDIAIGYLAKLNDILEGTPFKVAYRTRNEFLLYVVNNLPYSMDKDGNKLSQGYVIARALDEITSMKILSRIEGDDTKVKESLLDNLMDAVKDGLSEISGEDNPVESVSIAKLKEMKGRLNSGYTSFWS